VSVLMVLFAAILVQRSSTGFYAVYVHPSTDKTSEATLQRLAQFGINTIFVDIYYPTDAGAGVFLAEKKVPWTGRSREPEFAEIFSLDETIANASKFGISVHVTISCFGELPAIDPTNELHRMHLGEVVEYILTNFPSVSGIHLDYVRYINEWGLEANGNGEPITSFVRGIRQMVKGKALSAAVLAAADWGEYNVIRNRAGQDCQEISQYLDFMCPMAYHLSFGRKLEWIGSVSRFMSSIAKEPCKVFPTVQAYFDFEREIVVSNQGVAASILGPTLEVPSTGMLQFDIDWQNRESQFSLTLNDSFSREISAGLIVKYAARQTGKTYVVNCSVTGTWSTGLRVHSLSGRGDAVSLHVSDLNEEFPGYLALRSATSTAMSQANGFCVYALNDLSPEEFQAINDSVTTAVYRFSYWLS